MKKILILGGALCLLGAMPANAEVNFNVDLGLAGAQPSYYAEPGPAYVAAPRTQPITTTVIFITDPNATTTTAAKVE